MRRAHGFSLLELLAVTAMVGVLAAIALPSYGSYVLRANRAVAKAALLEIAARQESYFIDRKGYSPSLSSWYSVDAADAGDLLRDGRFGPPAAAIYRIRLGAVTATSYVIEAVPVNQQARDADCGTLTYDNFGNRGASGRLGASCWR